MLADHISTGVKITGLFDLLSDGRPAMEASWTFQKNRLWPNVISFSAGTGTGNKISVLPYRRGKNAEVAMTGLEVISGEFTGCIMGVFRRDGSTVVNHVDTEKDSDGEMPQKAAWESEKSRDGFELIAEASTLGEIPKYVEGLSDKKVAKFRTGLVVLCIASPAPGHSITRVLVFRDESHNYKVLKVLA